MRLSDAGVDYVKFQTFNSKKISKQERKKSCLSKRKYQQQSDSQLTMLQKLELSKAAHLELIDYCKTKNIKFLSTGFDLESIRFFE